MGWLFRVKEQLIMGLIAGFFSKNPINHPPTIQTGDSFWSVTSANSSCGAAGVTC